MAERFDKRAFEFADDLARGACSAEELCRLHLRYLEHSDPALHAFLTVDAEGALARARAVDQARQAGQRMLPLAGVPVAIKDNIVTKGLATSAASRILEGYRPVFDATVIERLSQHPILGKTNMDEFGMGSSTEHSAFGPTKNPWDLARVPGGSSGGSAAAVAAGLVPWALGTDTGGSIRTPASFCGIFGLKPTYGRVSRYGLLAYASSLDQIGPLARSAQDLALALECIAGVDERDQTSAPLPTEPYAAKLNDGVRGLRVGVVAEYMDRSVDEAIRAGVERAVAQLAELGAEISSVHLPHTEYALDAYYVIAPAEASANLARYDGIRFGMPQQPADDLPTAYMRVRGQGFGTEVKRRIMLGTYALSAGYYDAYYVRAQRVRTLIRRDFEEAFGQVDVLVGPSSPTVAFKIGERISDPLQMYLADVLTVPINLAGVPALSMPMGLTQGLPMGLQLIGRPFEEATLLRTAHTLEHAAEWARAQRPEGVRS